MASLTDLAKKVRNTKNRQSQAFLRTESIDTSGTEYTIDAVDTTNDVFTVNDQDVSGDLSAGDDFYVTGSTGNDQIYEVASINTGDLDNETDGTDSEITTVESIDDATADGSIYLNKSWEYVNVGRIMDASFDAEPVASDADQDGRESSQLFDVTTSWSMMQASNEELSLLTDLALPKTPYEFYVNGHYIYFSGTNQVETSEINAATDSSGVLSFGTGSGELDDPDGILFQNVLLKPSAEISLDGETAMLPVEFTGRLPLDEVGSVDTNQKITIAPT